MGLVGCSYIALTGAVGGGVGRMFLYRTYRGCRGRGWSDVLMSHLPGLLWEGLVGCSYVALTGAVGGGVGRMFLCRTSEAVEGGVGRMFLCRT